jgi:hypothetical protein
MKAGTARRAIKKPRQSPQDTNHHPAPAIPVLVEMLNFGDAEDRQLAAATLDRIERCCADCRSLLAQSRLR